MDRDPNDPLAPFRHGQGQANANTEKQQPLTEHEALKLAIEALNAVPNYRIKTPTHNTTYDLIPDLQATYDQGARDGRPLEAAPNAPDVREENDRLKAVNTELLEAAQRVVQCWEKGDLAKAVRELNAAIVRSTPEQPPARELTATGPERDRDIEPDL